MNDSRKEINDLRHSNKYFKLEADTKSELASKRDLVELKLDLTEKINRSKTETIVWIVGIGIVQFVQAILAKKFM